MLARVFPTKTNATPDDQYAFIGEPPADIPCDITEIHISCTFTWDKLQTEQLAEKWSHIAPVKIGGPAYNDRGETFTPGKYLKKGRIITSRGCPNKCWFCVVPKREGPLRELPITEGSNLMDDNILACSDQHIKKVFAMLNTQAGVQLSGGLEARRLKDWHVELFGKAKVQNCFFAYDSPDDYEPLVTAAETLKRHKWYTWRKCGCYCLIGYPGDTLEKAEQRLKEIYRLGFHAFAMFYRDPENKNQKTKEWRHLQRIYCNPFFLSSHHKTNCI
ncbi:MAG: hypothetical protein RR091_10320 [Cloacibacillus sp.]